VANATAARPLLEVTERGLFCAAGGFFVDPWQPVDRAVITHAHSDHACAGCGHYLVTPACAPVLRARIGPEADIDCVAYGEAIDQDGVTVSLHPAGHILGSAQVRIAHRGEVWVVSGDYKLEADPTCAAFELVRCHVFVTESTFGLPVYRWPPQGEVFTAINGWWRANQDEGKASVLFGYALGKAQRILAGIDPGIGPIACHGAVATMNEAYRAGGVALPAASPAVAAERGTDWGRSLILAPPSADASPWLRRFGTAARGFASGWMRIRGTRRRRNVDRGFVLSDHADWPGLLAAIVATGAERVLVTHGYSAVLARWLCEKGITAAVLATHFQGERDDPAPGEPRAEE
jgi:putative mRNA 3-end processing factor